MSEPSFTLLECQARAAEKRALAISDPEHRRKHMLAVHSWDFLAGKLAKAEKLAKAVK